MESRAGKAFSVSSTLMILFTRFVRGLTLVDGGALASVLLVPLLAGVLSAGFSFSFLVPMPKEERKRKKVKEIYITKIGEKKIPSDNECQRKDHSLKTW